MSRNYTDAEAAYCQSQPNPAASFAARWVGKEAVFKSLGVAGKGAAASLRDIEILPDSTGAPQVTLHGDAKAAAGSKGIKKVLISLSHSEVSLASYYVALDIRTHRPAPFHRPSLSRLLNPLHDLLRFAFFRSSFFPFTSHAFHTFYLLLSIFCYPGMYMVLLRFRNAFMTAPRTTGPIRYLEYFVYTEQRRLPYMNRISKGDL